MAHDQGRVGQKMLYKEQRILSGVGDQRPEYDMEAEGFS